MLLLELALDGFFQLARKANVADQYVVELQVIFAELFTHAFVDFRLDLVAARGVEFLRQVLGDDLT